jgi:hypothetical protein
MIVEGIFIDCNFSIKLWKKKKGNLMPYWMGGVWENYFLVNGNNALLNRRDQKNISWLMGIMPCWGGELRELFPGK